MCLLCWHIITEPNQLLLIYAGEKKENWKNTYKKVIFYSIIKHKKVGLVLKVEHQPVRSWSSTSLMRLRTFYNHTPVHVKLEWRFRWTWVSWSSQELMNRKHRQTFLWFVFLSSSHLCSSSDMSVTETQTLTVRSSWFCYWSVCLCCSFTNLLFVSWSDRECS